VCPKKLRVSRIRQNMELFGQTAGCAIILLTRYFTTPALQYSNIPALLP
jgi:hypothetical protein